MIMITKVVKRRGKREKTKTHHLYHSEIYYSYRERKNQVIILEIAYHIACEGINGTFRGH